MTLAAADPFDAREFLVEATSTPAARLRSQQNRASYGGARQRVEGSPQVGVNTHLRLTVREPATHAVVRDFIEVHEKPYHLFVLSHDLDYYDHVHPQQRADGSFDVDVAFPKPGFYKLYSDFLPLGATPQVVAATIATAGFSGTLASQRARLVPDETLTKTVVGMRVQLTLPTDGLVAGRDEKLQYHVVDVATGTPVADLEPYLAAYGHTLVVSEDTLHYVHAHPVELPDYGAAAGGGPDLTFKAMLPKPGRYRVWTQLKRRGVVSTVSFNVAVASPAER